MNTDLTLPGRISETALTLPAKLSFEDWQDVGETLGRIGRAHQWWIGDWLNYGERAYGEKYTEAVEKTALAYDRLRAYGWVAREVETDRRRSVLSFSHHEEVAALEPAEQDKYLKKAEKEKWSVSELRRAVKYAHVASSPAVALPAGSYNLLLADPPWQYDQAVPSRAIERHYLTMTTEEIEALKVPAADGAVLFLWAVAPKVPDALGVMQAWGFAYKTGAVWDKELKGLGYWFRGQHEHLLVGTRGETHPPAEDARFSSVFREKRTEHSKKPICVYEAIESMFPKATKVELFAREVRAGWSSWGNEL